MVNDLVLDNIKERMIEKLSRRLAIKALLDPDATTSAGPMWKHFFESASDMVESMDFNIHEIARRGKAEGMRQAASIVRNEAMKLSGLFKKGSALKLYTVADTIQHFANREGY